MEFLVFVFWLIINIYCTLLLSPGFLWGPRSTETKQKQGSRLAPLGSGHASWLTGLFFIPAPAVAVVCLNTSLGVGGANVEQSKKKSGLGREPVV